MRDAEIAPEAHLFVCANRRPQDSPLGPGCGDAGDALFDALKAEVAARREYGRVWITKTMCLGVCPKHGATVARYPEQRILSEALASDAPAIYASLDEGKK